MFPGFVGPVTVLRFESPGLNHKSEVVPGIRKEECPGLMRRFFRDRRD